MSRLVRRAGDRTHTRTEWLDSAHSFSFGQAYDPDNIHFGSLLAFNEDRLAAHSGYEQHLHRNTEILSWVLSGELTHADSAGTRAVLRPGAVQYLSAGSGLEHSERNESAAPLHFLQMWLMPSEHGTAPDYRQLELAERLATGQLVRVASSDPGSGELSLRSAGASLWIGRLPAAAQVALPVGEVGFAFIARGSVEVTGVGTLLSGDELRLRDSGAELRAGDRGAEVLFWQLAQLV